MAVNELIAILKLIRDNQPINLQRFESLIIGNSKDYGNLAHLSRSPLRSKLVQIVSILTQSGLVKEEKAKDSKSPAKYVTTDQLPLIQSVLGISLTDLVKSGSFTKSYPIFGDPLGKGNWTRIFVAMPFRDDLRPIYSDHIQVVAKSLDISCKRGDDFFNTNRIMDDVWSAIYHSELCIVDCTGRNPNVFYELGIAHTLGRKTILIAQNIEDIPFDIRHLRTIIYQYTPPGMKQFEERLKKTIQQELEIDE